MDFVLGSPYKYLVKNSLIYSIYFNTICSEISPIFFISHTMMIQCYNKIMMNKDVISMTKIKYLLKKR